MQAASGLGVREDILRNRLNLERALVLALTKIRPRNEVLARQQQAQSSHCQVIATLIIHK
jgi:hypothetical protein